tara:strand:- start:327 stop:698 length:372 start_codon:yes stop_codon:yes gene_type:complete
MISGLFYLFINRGVKSERSFNYSLVIGSLIYMALLSNETMHFYSSIIIPFDMLLFLEKYLSLKEPILKTVTLQATPILPIMNIPPQVRVNKIYPEEEIEKNNYRPTKLDIYYTMKQTIDNIKE